MSTAGATAAEAPEAAETVVRAGADTRADIRERLLAIPGMALVSEEQVGRHRFFILTYEQPVDHEDPSKGTFRQRLSLLHKDTGRPSVFHTTGYHLWPNPERSEPARIIDGNEVSLEHRYFAPSIPAPEDWTELNIRQAAADQHRLFTELKKVYPQKWISTGASKGGMTAAYYERFHPGDMDAVVVYVAPADVHDKEDSAYDRFFRRVGTTECRDRVNALQREGLIRRAPLVRALTEAAARDEVTFRQIGGVDRAYESAVTGWSWGFWQNYGLDYCGELPAEPAKAADGELFAAFRQFGGFYGGSDDSLATYRPYYYQAGTELGSPSTRTPRHLRGLVRYPEQGPRDYVPSEIPMAFQPKAMKDIDRWVRRNADRMLFVNGAWDPWSAEPFRLGGGARDSHVLTAPGTGHWADVSWLPERERAFATARIQRWAGVAPAVVRADPSKARPLARHDARLDGKDRERQQRRLGALPR
ncbi:secreted tripeptidyl aminopeptidase [Streptomyces clavuligerus]|nr:secreted tripeptidyl aminopeptidase [Streptomyces clavuligerus]